METRNSPRQRTPGRWIWLNVLVGLVAFAVAQLGNALTVVPGYATAIWLPSGVAFAAAFLYGWRVLPGIVAWNVLFHLWTTFEPDHPLRWAAVNGEIATMSALQAWVGCRLVHRFVDVRRGLAEVAETLRFLFLAGPVSCLVSASTAIPALWLDHRLAGSQAAFAWLTWWAGDCMGVVIVAPIALVTLARPRSLWRARTLPVAVPLIVAFALSIVSFHRSHSFERERLDQEFHADARVVDEAMVRGLARYADVLILTRAHIAASPSLSRKTFRDFAAVVLERYPGLHALAWDAEIHPGDISSLEQAARSEGQAGFSLKERRPDDKGFARVGLRDTYTVVRYIEPEDANIVALGYDVASNPERHAALAAAHATGRPTATPALKLVQSIGIERGILVFLPVSLAELSGRSYQADGPVAGYVTAIFEIPEMMEAVLGPYPLESLAVRVTDAASQGTVLYQSPSWQDVAENAAADGLVMTHELPLPGIDGARWTVTLEPTRGYVEARRSLQSWAVLVGGLAFTGLFGAFLLIVTGRTAQLEREVAERRRIEHDLKDAKTAAEAASEAKSTFLANMSHEIRTPLAAMLGFTDLLAAANAESPDRGRFLATIQRNGRHLVRLIDDILDLSSVEAGKLEIHREPVTLRTLLADVQAALELAATKKGLTLDLAVGPQVPAQVLTDPVRLRQILMNIVGNAVKFTETGSVRVAVESAGDQLVIHVHDTGVGLTKEESAALFEPFTQVDMSLRRRLGGTGLGLSLSRRLARLLGGDVVLTASRKGEGSTFTITLPQKPVIHET